MEVQLRSTDGAGRLFALPLYFRDAGPGRWIATFRFEDIPSGVYACVVNHFDPMHVWPESIEVVPPATGLEFAEVQTGTLVALNLEVVDALDGAPIPDAWVWLQGDGLRTKTISASRATREYVHPDAEIAWAVGAPERVPRFGSRAELTLSEEKLTARVPLSKGFGLRLAVSDPGGTALANVRVGIDGAFVGTTGSDGLLLLEAEAAPRTIELEHASWRAPSDLDALFSSAVAAGQPHLAVAMQLP